MKAVFTLFFVLFFGLMVQAQDQYRKVEKVRTIQMEMVQLTDIKIAPAESRQEVARLYRRAGSRVQKELRFTTKKDFQIA